MHATVVDQTAAVERHVNTVAIDAASVSHLVKHFFTCGLIDIEEWCCGSMLNGNTIEQDAQRLALFSFVCLCVRVLVFCINHMISTLRLVVKQVARQDSERVELPRLNNIIEIAVDEIR